MMWNQLKDVLKSVACAVWSHRAVYAGLAAAYGAGCFGWIDKDAVQQVVCALYVLLVAQSDH